MPWRPGRAAGSVLAAVVSVAVGTGLDVLGPAARADGWLWDRVSSIGRPTLTDTETIVFALDDASIRQLQPLVGAWPYRRDVWAHVLDYLRAHGAAHVTLDVLLADARDGDEQLREALLRSPDVMLAAVPVPFRMGLDRERVPPDTRTWLTVDPATPARVTLDVVLPRPEFRAVARVGSAYAAPDADGLVRRIPLLTRIGSVWLPSLAVGPLATPAPDVRTVQALRGTALQIGDRRWPVDTDGQVTLRIPATRPAFESRPLSELIRAAVGAHADADLPGRVRGRQVFVGVTALLLDEAVPTPLGRLPGVEFIRMASVLLRDGHVVHARALPIDAAVLLMLLGLVALARRWWQGRPAALVLSLAGVVAALALVAWIAVALVAQRIWIVAPASAAATLAGLLTLGDLARLRRERARVDAERQAAERASELKTQFLNHVAHELRTPVTAILGFGRLIVEARDARETREYARVISRNGAHLLQLVNNLLDDATIAVGRVRIAPQPVDVRQLISDVLATVEGLPRQDGVTLAGTIDPAVPGRVSVDALRVRQILLNLLANALKFTEVGSIDLSGRWEQGRLSLVVQDTGTGIPAADLARVFDEYEQGSPRAVRAGGTGLGLSVSRRLARLMGGDLDVQSVEGRGSRFTLTVPAPEAAPLDNPLLADTDGDVPSGNGPLILVCDDVDDIRELFTLVLADAGARVMAASSGQDAVAMAVALAPDAILLDLDLIDQDGLTTASQIRTSGYRGPIIAVSGSGEDRDASLRQHGFTDSTRKPVSGALLVDLVARHVPRWRPRRASMRVS